MEGNHSDTTALESVADRLIAAAQPALAAELDNIVAELRARIEAETDIRLKKAVIEKEIERKAELERLRQSMTAEAEANLAAQLNVEREKVAEAEAKFRSELDEERQRHAEAEEKFRSELDEERQKVAEAEARFQSELDEERQRIADREAGIESKLDEERRRMAEENERRLEERLTSRLAALSEQKDAEARAAAETWNEQQKILDRELERWRTLAEYLNKLGESSSQLEILRRFLLSGSRFASSVAVYLQKSDGLSLWKTEGEHTAFPDPVSDDTIDPEWFYSTVVVRGKTVAAVCAADVQDKEALVVMVAALKRAVENFGLRLRFMAGEARATDGDPRPGSDREPDAAPPGAAAVEESGPETQAHRSASESSTPQTATMTADRPMGADDPRRLARVIVAEIKLRFEKQVLEGRVNGDLYQRLRAPIEEGRQEYASRVNPSPESDFFHEEVVKILADNVASRLGADYPGPR